MDAGSNSTKCPLCGRDIPADAPAGWCLACTFGFLLEPNSKEEGAEPLSLQDVPRPRVKFSCIGDYDLLELIAQGGMGVVYKARQRSLNRIVALKMLLGGAHAGANYKRRFRQEAKAAAALNHPNIVSIHDWGEDSGQPFFSMDYIQGKTLAEIAHVRPLPPRAAAAIVHTLAQVMHYAHSQGVLHRDLKPSNVLVDAAGAPHITDFGLARQLNEETALTNSGQFMGTPGYLPPEQVSAKRESVGVRSDVYGLGAILYYLLTGRPPHGVSSLAEVLRAVEENEPVSPRKLNASVPADLETICLKCLEKRPLHRYRTAELLAAELNKWLEGEAPEPIPLRRVAAKWIRRRRRALLAAAALVLLLASIGAILSWWGKPRALRNELTNFSPGVVILNSSPYPQEGTNVAFHAAAYGPGPYRFQWLFNERKIPNATNITLNIKNVSAQQTGRYRVQMTSPAGLSESENSLLLVSAGDPAELWVSSIGSKRIHRFDARTGQILGIAADGAAIKRGGPENFAFGPDGDTYVAWGNAGAVHRFDRTSGAFLGPFIPSASNRPEEVPLRHVVGLAFGPEKDLYLADLAEYSIKRYHGATGAFITNVTDFEATNRSGVGNQIQVGPDGMLYFSSSFDKTIKRLNVSNHTVTVFINATNAGIRFPNSFDFSSDGRIYVLDAHRTGGIHRFDSKTGQFIDTVVAPLSGGMEDPVALKLGPNDILYVASADGRAGIRRFHAKTGEFVDLFIQSGQGGMVDPGWMLCVPQRKK